MPQVRLRRPREAGYPYICLFVASAALALVVALPACSKGAEETKTGHEPKAVHAFLPVDDRAVRMAKAELARRTFLLGKGEKERQQAYEMLKLLDREEAWILEVSTAEEMVVERKEAEAEAARRRLSLAQTERERQQALEELKRLDPEDDQDLQDLDPGELADWRKEFAMEEARLQFLAAKTDEERERAYEAIKRLDPEAAEALLEGPEKEKEASPKVDEKASLEARVEEARRRFLLAKTAEERQRTMTELNSLDPDEAWTFQHSTAEEMAVKRKKAAAEEARRRFLLAKTYEERKRALAELKRLDPDEVDDLRNMAAETLVEERDEAALEEALLQFYIAQTEQERKRAYEEVKRLDPYAAEDLLE